MFCSLLQLDNAIHMSIITPILETSKISFAVQIFQFPGYDTLLPVYKKLTPPATTRYAMSCRCHAISRANKVLILQCVLRMHTAYQRRDADSCLCVFVCKPSIHPPLQILAFIF